MERRRGASQLKTKPALRLDLEPQHKQQVAPRRVLLRAAEAQPVLGCGRRVALAASLHRGVAAVAGQFDGSRRDVALQVSPCATHLTCFGFVPRPSCGIGVNADLGLVRT